MKRFFRIETKYRFEWNDLRAVITILNVFLILRCGLSFAWFPFIVAVVGIVKDLTTDHRLNNLIMHIANTILNGYFLLIFYKIIY